VWYRVLPARTKVALRVFLFDPERQALRGIY
jgi:hypothetical protein